MTPTAMAVIAVTVLATSFLSGIFGMAGGMILLGVMLMFLDVAPAMVLFGAIQGSANGWRALLWRAHVRWDVVWRYIVGATAAFLVMRLVAFVPDKAVLYLLIGGLPFLARLVPDRWVPDVSTPGGPYLCGLVILTLQLIAGGAGHILDMFFQRSGFDRRGIVGTKAICQTLAHVYRILYFGSFASAFDVAMPWWAFAGAIGLALAGTSLAARVLERMSDADFRKWTARIVLAVALTFLARGLWLLLTR
jgi:uncharacterized membrane protein YfcA